MFLKEKGERKFCENMTVKGRADEEKDNLDILEAFIPKNPNRNKKKEQTNAKKNHLTVSHSFYHMGRREQ